MILRNHHRRRFLSLVVWIFFFYLMSVCLKKIHHYVQIFYLMSVSVVRTGGLLSCGVLCSGDVPPRASFSRSSSVSTGEGTSEFVGELGGCFFFLFLLVAAELSDTERRRPSDVSVLFFVFCAELVEDERIIPKGFGEELEALGVDARSFVCVTIESLLMDGFFVFGLSLF
jgi:hypothetical protein